MHRKSARHLPPRLTLRFLEWLLSPEHDTVIGDMEEAYFARLNERGPVYARARFRLDALVTIPRVLISDLFWFPAMFRNYVSTAVRNLLKYKGFSAINIAGLAVSMAVCLLIIALIHDQRSYDTFHERADDIYRVTTTVQQSWGTSRQATSPGPLGPALLANSPHIDVLARMRGFAMRPGTDERTREVHGLYAEPTFLELFSFPLQRGAKDSVLDGPGSIVLTKRVAELFFPGEDAMGQTLRRDDAEYVVTGILEEIPRQSHLEFDVLVSFSTIEELARREGDTLLNDWTNSTNYYTYFRLRENATPEAVEHLAAQLFQENDTSTDRPAAVPSLQAVRDINLGYLMHYQIGRVMPVFIVYFMSVLGLLLIGIAVFNYMTLSVARSLKRAREIGIRKVVGASRGQLIRQFLSEAVMISVLALGGAILILAWLMPAFSAMDLVQEELGLTVSIDWLGDFGLYGAFLVTAVVVGLLAGLYPALVMSRFMPVSVLKGTANMGGLSSSVMRKVLIVSQFTVAIVGIVVTLVMQSQFTHILTTDYGFDKEQLVHVELQGQPYDLVRQALMAVPGVEQVAGITAPLIVGGPIKSYYRTTGMDQDRLIRFLAVDGSFLEMFDVDLVAGRNFTTDVGGDQEAILINERALPVLGFETPGDAVGETMVVSGRTVTIVGVVADFTTSEMASGNEPTVLVNRVDFMQVAAVRIRPGMTAAALSGLEDAWNRVAPSFELKYSFFDDQMRDHFQGYQDLASVLGLVVGFIVFIACLGLLGMASYATEARVREVGIRKVMGATNRSVVFLLSRDYVVLVVIAACIGLPLAWLLSDVIMQGFADRITVHAGYFLVGILGTLGLALITVGSQTLRAGRLNPVDTLRSD